MALLPSHSDHYVWDFLQRVSPGGYQLLSDTEGRRLLAPNHTERKIVRLREVAVFQEPTLLDDLPRHDDPDATLLAFANRYGLLGTQRFRSGADEGESIDDWRTELTALHDARRWLNQVRDGLDTDFMEQVEAALVTVPNEAWFSTPFVFDREDQQRSALAILLNHRLADVSVRIWWSGKAQALTWKLAVPNLLTALWLRLLWETEGVVKKRLCQCGCGTPIDPNRNGTKLFLNPHHKLKAQDQKRKAARAAQRVATTRPVRPRTAARRSRRRPKR